MVAKGETPGTGADIIIQAPTGAAESRRYLVSFAPLGLFVTYGHMIQGLHPWLQSVAPVGG
jgi:hypothetical protein